MIPNNVDNRRAQSAGNANEILRSGEEVHYFGSPYPRGLVWYLEQFAHISADQQTIEKTPSYFVAKHDFGECKNSLRGCTCSAFSPTRKSCLAPIRKSSRKRWSSSSFSATRQSGPFRIYLQQSILVKTRHNKSLESRSKTEMVMKNRSTGWYLFSQYAMMCMYYQHGVGCREK